jgi:hypothetical protein
MVVVMVSVAFADEESPNPIPSFGNTGQAIQNPSTDKNQEAGPPDAISKDYSFLINRQDSAVVSKPDVQDSGKQPSEPSPKSYLAWESWPWDAITTFTFALVIVGSLQVCVYCRQARYMRDGLEATRQSAKAAQDSADAAMKSAEVATTTLEVVERAFLSPEKWEFEPRGNASPYSNGLVCTLRNTGGTPATLVEGAILFMRSKGTPAFLNCLQLAPTQEGRFTVHAQEALPYVLSLPAESLRAEIQKVGKNEMIYFYGRITYMDVFDNRHHLIFCVYESPTLRPVTEGGYNYTETEKKNK